MEYKIEKENGNKKEMRVKKVMNPYQDQFK